jgi:hypothetical protein
LTAASWWQVEPEKLRISFSFKALNSELGAKGNAPQLDRFFDEETQIAHSPRLVKSITFLGFVSLLPTTERL